MAWGKVDDNLAFHPKVICAGNEAMGVWVRALSWAMQQLTDGFVPRDIVVALKGTEMVNELLACSLWHEVDGGYQFNDWCQYQPSREQVLGERAKTQERVAKWRENKNGNGVSNGVTNGVSNGVSNSAPTRPDPTHKSIEGRSMRLPSTFQISDEMRSWFESKNLTVDIDSETEKFVNYYAAAPGKAGLKVDWVATWRNWLLKANEWAKPKDEFDPWAGKQVFQ